jgi:hypothetical protein
MAIFKTKKRTNSARVYRGLSKNGIDVRYPFTYIGNPYELALDQVLRILGHV